MSHQPRMRVYLSGPMTGYPEHNKPAFHARAWEWRREGWDVFSPAEEPPGYTEANRPEYLKRDIRALLDCDAIAVLPGWQKSEGARMEVTVAKALRYPIYDANTFAPYEESALQEAQRLVHGDRGATYGHPLDDYTTTAALFTAILGAPVTAEQAILCMIAVKLSRLTRKPDHRDSAVDVAGYAECLTMVIAERKRRP